MRTCASAGALPEKRSGFRHVLGFLCALHLQQVSQRNDDAVVAPALGGVRGSRCCVDECAQAGHGGGIIAHIDWRFVAAPC